MKNLKVVLMYTGFWTLFFVCFAAMFAMLTAAVMGIPAGVMLAVLGTAILMFRADFIISDLAPEIMLFGGLSGAFFSAFLGALAVKIGFSASKLFVKTRRRAERLKERPVRPAFPDEDDEEADEALEVEKVEAEETEEIWKKS